MAREWIYERYTGKAKKAKIARDNPMAWKCPVCGLYHCALTWPEPPEKCRGCKTEVIKPELKEV